MATDNKSINQDESNNNDKAKQERVRKNVWLLTELFSG